MPVNITDRFLKSKKTIPTGGQADYFDKAMPGFGVRASYKGTRSFFVMGRLDGKRVRVMLKPSYGPAMSLADARKLGGKMLQQIEDGIDPREERKAQKVEAAKRRSDTYETAVRDYIRREQKNKRKNATANEVERVLLREGEDWKIQPVSSITPEDVRGLLEAIRDGKAPTSARPYLANRTYAYMRSFFGWCAEVGINKIDRSPMEGLTRPWDGEEARDRVFTTAELKKLWKAGDAIGDYGGAFVKLLLLTGKRKSALSAMRWDEIDDAGVWTPKRDNRRRTRTKRVHETPLPALAMRILSGLLRVDGNPYVFIGRVGGKHLDPGTPLQKRIQIESGVGDFFWHAVRHTVETALARGWQIGPGKDDWYTVPPHVRDLLLDHAPNRGAGAGYDHYAYTRETRDALDAWAERIEQIAMPEGVRALR